MTSAIHAILVGINDYEDAAFSPLKHSVDDARKIKNLLLQDLGADEGSIRVLENSDATKDGIMEALQSISTRAERNDAIVFFFSGYAALSDENDSEQQVGFLCPYDAQSSGGLSDKSLLRTFELLSKQCGNNITVFLDTSGDALKWENPPSCVVIYPNQASEDDHGGLFTSAITEVLQIQCSKFDSIALTVEAFAERVESIIQATKGDEVVVRCTGWNIDRPLFNSEGDQGHYALIPGYTQKDGGIILKAGAAHNVKSGSIYRIFKRNIMLEDGFGELPGQKLRADVVKGFTAELSFINETATKLPPFFYAVEDPSIDAKIASAESNVLNGIYKPTPESKEEEADLTLVEAEGKIRYIWKGLDNDIKITDRKDLDESLDSPKNSKDVSGAVRRFIRRTAHFHGHVAAPPPTNSTVSDKLRFVIQEVDTDAEELTAKTEDLLHGKDLLEIHFNGKQQIKGPYCLTIHNDNSFPVWPYVFMCDPETLTIVPWYKPARGDLDPPLKKNETLTIGLQSEDNLLFEHRENRDYDLLYLKVFVTKRKVDFSCIQQWYRSSKEDQLRADYEEIEYQPQGQSDSRSNDSTSEEQERKKKPTLSQWASKRITVLVKYGINEDSEENNSREGDNDEPPYTEGEEDGQEQEGGNGNEE